MKHISVRVALAFSLVCLVLIVTAALLLYASYRRAIVNEKYEDLRAVYAESARLIREHAASAITDAELDASVDLVSRVGKCKIYVLRFDPAEVETAVPEGLGIRTREIQGDLLLIAEDKTVFRELVYRDNNDAPYVFYGGPAPLLDGTGAILIYTSAGQMYTDVASAATAISLGSGGLVLIAAVLVFFVADRLMRPLRQMTQRARLLAQGESVADVPERAQDEIGALTRAFNYMKTRVIENENARQEFLASVSHDIRTPLTHIRTSALGLKEGWLPPEMHERAIDMITDESLRLIEMTNDLIETARLQSGPMELRLSVTELCTLLRDAAEHCPEPDQVVVDCAASYRVNVDESLFRRVMTNLLDNAFRYARPPVELSGWKENGICHIQVRDHGDGLPPEELERIFERFYRVKAHTNQQHGSGIGLHFARRALELHGGTIEARNVPDGGLEFLLSWPDTLDGL